MKENLFFIENIIEHSEHEEEGKNKQKDEGKNDVSNHIKYTLVLLKMEENSNFVSEFKILGKDSFDQKEDMLEGSYVYLNGENEIEKAGSDSRAKREVAANNFYRGNLINKHKENKADKKEISSNYVFSYHVNVGHGNCSIIVIRMGKVTKVWFIDCSEFDMTNKKNYRNNIKSCIKYIQCKFDIFDFKVDKLLVTHPHYDHINGIIDLINKNYLRGCEIWINKYYSWPSRYYNLLLKELNSLNTTLVEPIVSNSTSNIEIIYPDKTILRVSPSPNTKYTNYDIVPKNKVNNSSIVYRINFNGKSIIFPGDIETDGWNKIVNCYPYLNNATYYCLSHHGSFNGHKRTTCPVASNLKDVGMCTNGIDINILMGRNGAYSGIFNNKVLSNYNNRIFTTDYFPKQNVDLTFLELNWQTDIIKRHGIDVNSGRVVVE